MCVFGGRGSASHLLPNDIITQSAHETNDLIGWQNAGSFQNGNEGECIAKELSDDGEL